MVHSTDINSRLHDLQNVLGIGSSQNVVLSMMKPPLKPINWCGRIIDSSGVTMNLASYYRIFDEHLPRNGAELCQFVYALLCISLSIPNLARRLSVLRKTLEKTYQTAGKRTKASVQKVHLRSIGWVEPENASFLDLKEQLRYADKTADRDLSKTLRLFTDSRDLLWSGTVTKCDLWNWTRI